MVYCWKGLLPVLLLLRAGPVPAAAAPDICNVPGQCSDELLGIRFAESLESCIIQGRQLEGANFVSWKPTPSGPCEVFAECEIEDSLNALTSSLDCKVCGVAGLCTGHIQAEADLQDALECEQLCLETPTCAWFTYLEEQQYCLIFADCTSLTTDCTNCYTSMRSCLQETSTTPSTTTPATSPTTTAAADMNKILYISHYEKTTLVSLDGTTGNCDLEDYPATSNNPAAVTYNNGEVLACGGHDLEDADRCWRFDGSAWSSLPNSNQKHCYVDSPNVVMNEGWWVTGWLQAGDGSCSSSPTSEIYTGATENAWIPGPALPGDEYPGYSCVVNLNTTHTVLIGGYRGGYRRDTWLYDWSSQAWTRTGSLIQGRDRHGCVGLGDLGILVVGGYDGSDVHTAELYDPVLGTWSSQPDLPADIYPRFPILLNWDDQVLALFRGEDQIYQQSQETGEWSVLDGGRLPGSFQGYTYDKAVLVPGNWSC